MGTKRLWDEKRYQPTWEDVDAWAQQLYDDHHLWVKFTVFLPHGKGFAVKPAVMMVAHQYDDQGNEAVRHVEFVPLNLRSVGQAETIALRLLSHTVMALDGDRWRAEAATGQLELPF